MKPNYSDFSLNLNFFYWRQPSSSSSASSYPLHSQNLCLYYYEYGTESLFNPNFLKCSILIVSCFSYFHLTFLYLKGFVLIYFLIRIFSCYLIFFILYPYFMFAWRNLHTMLYFLFFKSLLFFHIFYSRLSSHIAINFKNPWIFLEWRYFSENS